MKRQHWNAGRFHRGLSLVELMVALAISLILLLGVAQIYVSTSATNRSQEGLSRVQENARFVLDLLARDIRLAGYSGCPRSAHAEPERIMAKRAPSDIVAPEDAIMGTDDASSSAIWDGDRPDHALEDTPAVRITFAGPGKALVEEGSFEGFEFSLERNPDDLTGGDLITITDCERTEIAEISNVSDGPGTSVSVAHGDDVNTPHDDLGASNAFTGSVNAMRTHRYVYYLGTNGEGNPALFRRDLAASDNARRSMELVENVDYMAIQYGQDTDGNGQVDRYRAAQDMGADDWAGVISVRTSLLLTSDEILTEPHDAQFDLLGNLVNGNNDPLIDGRNINRRVGQVATTTITLRNRTP